MKSSPWIIRLPGLYLAAILALTWLVYTPGFSGDFLFDDFSNLSQLGSYGPIDNLENLWLYLLGNFSGPTGRPVSMLSFLLDARNWPADPEPFKHTNVLIHLLNGLVLYALIRKLTQALGYNESIVILTGLLAASLWLLHPFWVSTTLYTVQRMAQLSTLFVLLGLLIYTSTRLKYPPHLTPGMIIGTGSAIWGMGILAVLSKENGVLLPLFVATLEITVLKVYDQKNEQSCSNGLNLWRLQLIGLPTLLLFSYLTSLIPPLLEGNQGLQSFTPGERLLTQGRILWDYFFHIIIPRPYTGGLFNDDIIVSTSLFQPWYTIIAWCTWVAIMGWALRNRTKHPATTLAILFFLCGHLLESSFIQLELYFEHRNYLSAVLLGFPISLWWLTRPINGLTRFLPPLLVLLILATLSGIRSDLWGHPFLQALRWSQAKQKSPRAQIYLAEQWRKTNNLMEAERLNTLARTLSPMNITALAQRVSLDCQLGRNPIQSLHKLTDTSINKTEIGSVDSYFLAGAIDFLIGGACGNSITPENILTTIKAIRDSELGRKNKALNSMLLQRAGIVLMQQKKPMDALNSFRHSTHLTPNPGIVLKNAAIMATYKFYNEALEYLDTTDLQEQAPNSWGIAKMRYLYFINSNYYQREKLQLREQIAKEVNSQKNN